ncbi:dopamine N-acetyltransferase [Bradysia coprophila]|uniref:dopamine N-acetyltransferase n=1 Tax=Bradysia coprophila TaxID=38358 RepID=UPI00187D8FB4|nr:dopamine N-acetyltransferase [Bradysia coprophila]
MIFQRITPDRYNDVIVHLRDSFFFDEPLNKAVKLCTAGTGNEELENYSIATLEDGLSIMAINDNEEIAGVALNGILLRGDIEEALINLSQLKDERTKKIFRLLYDQNLKLNLFHRFNVDKIFEIRILSVDAKFRGQGLAKELWRRSEVMATECNFQLMKADATGLFSQKVSISFGFSPCLELSYNTYTDKQGDPIFKVDPPHDNLKIMYKLINQKN